MIIQKNSQKSELITADYIKQGKLVIIPTDTIYGFSARVPDCSTVIKTIKGREDNKPFIELIKSTRMRKFLQNYWLYGLLH